MAKEKTIFALSTPLGRGAVAIIRISGTQTTRALEVLTKQRNLAPRQAYLRSLYHPLDGALMDEALVLYFAGPHSYTGEDMAELQLHGGLAVIEEVLEALGTLDNLSPAAAGDFTRRAVLNGKFDLTRAEAIADLIDAETRAQKSQALRQLRGALGELYGSWRERLSHALAHLEADIEFADENLPGGIGRAVLVDVEKLVGEIISHLGEGRGRALREGIEIALIGAPNVGKSSLLNYLAGREAAIVSGRAGTTRDVIEVAVAISGVPVIMADTAGLRAVGDEIEREGVRRARKRAQEADLKLYIFAPDQNFDDINQLVDIPPSEADFYILNKSDLGGLDDFKKIQIENNLPEKLPLIVSAKTGAGMSALWTALEKTVAQQFGLSSHPALTRQRHKAALDLALESLQRALETAHNGGGLELVAEDMRLAMREIGRITGGVDVEALLDIVFSDFCIGK